MPKKFHHKPKKLITLIFKCFAPQNIRLNCCFLGNWLNGLVKSISMATDSLWLRCIAIYDPSLHSILHKEITGWSILNYISMLLESMSAVNSKVCGDMWTLESHSNACRTNGQYFCEDGQHCCKSSPLDASMTSSNIFSKAGTQKWSYTKVLKHTGKPYEGKWIKCSGSESTSLATEQSVSFCSKITTANQH